MSLLMDALKKAEREREARASKEQGEETETPQELSLDPMEQPPPEPESAQTGDDDEPWDMLGDSGEVSHGFDLSLSESDLSLDTQPDSAPEPGPGLGSGAEPSFEPHALDGMEDIPLAAAPEDDMSIEDTSSTMPSMKAVKASVDRYFDGGQSVSMSMQMPLDQDDATTVVQKRASDEEAQAAAQSVFAAKAPKRRSGIWIWIFLVPLMVILLIGGVSSTGSRKPRCRAAHRPAPAAFNRQPRPPRAAKSRPAPPQPPVRPAPPPLLPRVLPPTRTRLQRKGW